MPKPDIPNQFTEASLIIHRRRIFKWLSGLIAGPLFTSVPINAEASREIEITKEGYVIVEGWLLTVKDLETTGRPHAF